MQFRVFFAALCFAFAGSAATAAPQVVVSIKPVHSLVARLMQGIGEPTLLVGGGASLHSYSLKPSQAAALEAADLVVWVGPTLESFLHDPLEDLARNAQVIEAATLPGMILLAPREGGTWEAHGDEEHEEHAPEGEVDGHLFLDPRNAATLAAAAQVALSQLDPANAAAYAANGSALQLELTALDQELAATLTPMRGVPYVVFHDAYQYLEARYDLDAIGSITVTPDQQPGARRLGEIRDKIASLGARCVFAEPQFTPALVETLVEGTGAGTGQLDPEGTALPPGPTLYAELLRGLASNLTACLTAS